MREHLSISRAMSWCLIATAALLFACTPAAAPSVPPMAGAGAGAPSAPAAAAPERLRIIYSSLSGSYMPMWVAAEAGLFQEQGLDAELLYISSGTTATQTLVAGEAPMANVAAAAMVGAIAEGLDAVYIQATVNVPPLTMFTRPDLRVPDELRGARVGVTRFGSSSDVVGRLLLRRWGLDPERDVAMLQLGGVPEMFGALQNGALDAAVLSDPNSLQAAKQGYPVAADAGELNIPYMHLGTVVTRKVLVERPDLLRRYLLAYQAGINRFFADGPFAQRMLGQYTHQDDPEVLEGTYRVYADRYISRDVRPRPETIATILAADTNPRVRELAADALVDDSLVRQLQAEGAIPTNR